MDDAAIQRLLDSFLQQKWTQRKKDQQNRTFHSWYNCDKGKLGIGTRHIRMAGYPSEESSVSAFSQLCHNIHRSSLVTVTHDQHNDHSLLLNINGKLNRNIIIGKTWCAGTLLRGVALLSDKMCHNLASNCVAATRSTATSTSHAARFYKCFSEYK